MTHAIVILGAGWTGLPLAHKLLKSSAAKTKIKVYLVTPNSHFFWNVAATRAIIPGEIQDEQLWYPIADQFAQYSSDFFELVLGEAASFDEISNSVTVRMNTGAERRLCYSQLVVATGSKMAGDVALKMTGDYETSRSAWNALQNQVGRAQDIVIAGSGATGCEIAGELAAKYGRSKRITLILPQQLPLQHQAGVLESVRVTMAKDLEKLGVQLLRGRRVVETKHDSGKRTTIVLSDGFELSADFYLPLFGVKVNTSFVPVKFLDDRGNIVLDDTLRVSGTSNIWALGDVGNLFPKQITTTDGQILYVAAAIDNLLQTSQPTKIKPFDHGSKTMVFVTMGRKYATGQIGGWRLPGWMVSYPKGRKLFVDTAPDYVAGKRLRHASM